MSFRCEACRQAQAPLVKPVLLPVEFRPKAYRDGMELGYEIAREARLCSSCASDIKPTVDGVLSKKLPDGELEVALVALRAVGRKELGV